MINTSQSQRGGEAAWRGLDYQKKFIAYLSLKMLLEKQSIKRITCEHLDDIEVEEQSKLLYYQVKSTSNSSLPKSDLIALSNFRQSNRYSEIQKRNIIFNDFKPKL